METEGPKITSGYRSVGGGRHKKLEHSTRKKMNLFKLSKLATMAASCLALAAPAGAEGLNHMGSVTASSTTTRAEDRGERRQEHVEQLTEKRQEHIEQLRERRDDRADSSTTRTGSHIKN